MRWRRRTDDARRFKGDPPPTVDSLIVTVRRQGELIRELRAEVDRLRIVVAEKTEYVEQLALELAEVRAGGICGDEAPTRIGCTTMRPTCKLLHGHASEWHQADTGERWRPRVVVDTFTFEAEATALDPDPTRPYIPSYDEEKS